MTVTQGNTPLIIHDFKHYYNINEGALKDPPHTVDVKVILAIKKEQKTHSGRELSVRGLCVNIFAIKLKVINLA